MAHGEIEEDLLGRVQRTPRRRRSGLGLSDLTVSKSSTLIYTYDDPDRGAFFLPLTILLSLHAFFLAHIYLYAPNPENLIFK